VAAKVMTTAAYALFSIAVTTATTADIIDAPMTEPRRFRDARIPEVNTVSQAERMFRVNWIASELRSPSGVPMHSPDYVSRLGRVVRIIDLRTPEELTGPLGYIPGSDWVPHEEALGALGHLAPEDPVVLVSRGGERASELAVKLEQRGMHFVVALMGGVIAWRQVGLSTIRDAAILGRRGRVRDATTVWESPKRHLSADEIERHVGDPLSTRWIKLAALLVSGRVSCVDGRDDSGVVGTPGGDAGEFLLSLAALERVTGRALDAASMRPLILRRLDAFGRFYLHSDVHASNALIKVMRADRRFDDALAHVWEPLEWRRFMTAPPESLRGALLEHMLEPSHIGCGHLRLSMQRAEAYGARRALVRTFLREFFALRWEGVDENEVAVLSGNHAEGAVVNVMLEDSAEAFSCIPLVSPMAEGSQMFMNHPQVAAWLRGQLVRFLARERDLVTLGAGGEAELLREVETLGATQMGHTLSALAAGLPVYDVVFDDDERVRVVAQGHVGGA
jgi:rhodanese-related sulfurtransferase